jgi:hypothetical protein
MNTGMAKHTKKAGLIVLAVLGLAMLVELLG